MASVETPFQQSFAPVQNNTPTTAGSNDSLTTALLTAPALAPARAMTQNAQQIEHQVSVVVEHKVMRVALPARSTISERVRLASSKPTSGQITTRSVATNVPASTIGSVGATRSSAVGTTGSSLTGASAIGTMTVRPAFQTAVGTVSGLGHH